MYSPFDINEAVAHRKEYVEEGLRSGSPVVGLAYSDGLLLLTVRRAQRKVYEVYDRQMFSAIGRQSDIENVRLAAIQNAHQEGFERSPDDVSLQRLVGFALSPTLKRAFGDQMYVPVVVRALFAELGRRPDNDVFFALNYDGEFRQASGAAAIAGTQIAEDRMMERLEGAEDRPELDSALALALRAWVAGAREALQARGPRDEAEFMGIGAADSAAEEEAVLRDELKTGRLEVGLLERRSNRESRFRLMRDEDLQPLSRDFR